MRKGLTEIVFILDRSGSMQGLEADTIGGFNSMMEKQKNEEGEACVSTILFDDRCEVLHDRLPIGEVPRMTEKDYYVRGCTALLDALGGAIHHIRRVQKETPKEDRPEKTLFVITTDGLENASKKYGYEKVKQMVERRRENQGWEFLFIGANMDAIRVAGQFGIQQDRAVDYVHDGQGTAQVYACVSEAVCRARKAQPRFLSQALSAGAWAEGIREDYQKRNAPSGRMGGNGGTRK